MLSPADADLVARDPAIPGLGVLLDPEAFAAALRAALPAAAIGGVEPLYARYKPGTNCLVAYRVALPAGPTMLYARAYAAALRAKLAHPLRLRARPNALGIGGLALDEPGIAIYSWPHDHDLPALTRLDGQRRRARLLAAICPERADLRAAALVHLRYRPERRYVGRLVGGARGDALLKLYCARDYAQARVAARAFHSAGPLVIAAPLGSADEQRALLFPWRPEPSLPGLLWDEARAPAALRLAGAALATLHAQGAAALPQELRDDPLAELAAAAGAISAICPALAPRVRRLAAALASELQAGPARLRPLHGDFYADQVLIGPGQATLLDLDNARWGDPAGDLGTFTAHLWRAVELGRGAASQAELLARALCAGYGEVAALPSPARLSAYSALGLLRLAPEPFRYRAPNWPAQVAALVSLAEAALIGALGRGGARAQRQGVGHD
jgi:hypothetical protein